MDLLNPKVMEELFMQQRRINTKVQDSPPAKYFPTAKVRNSLVATGCMVKGTVENSILFRGCVVDEGAVVRNSVIMPSGIISRDVLVEHVICDKQVHIGDEVRLFGTAQKPLIVTRKQYS
jgi:glucose-1-phosphate adenylyltransferase